MTMRWVCLLVAAAQAAAPARPAWPADAAPLSVAQRWALASGGILVRLNGDSFETLASSLGKDRARTLLARDWKIADRSSAEETISWLKVEGHSKDFREVRQMVSSLTDPAFEKLRKKLIAGGDEMLAAQADTARTQGAGMGDRGLTAWDQGRLVYLARLAHSAGYLSEAEAWSHIVPAARKLQKTCGSWEQAGEDYVVGRRFWNPQLADPREGAVLRWLREDPSSPWRRLPWQTPLDSR